VKLTLNSEPAPLMHNYFAGFYVQTSPFETLQNKQLSRVAKPSKRDKNYQ
jgi:hypothetical protein